MFTPGRGGPGEYGTGERASRLGRRWTPMIGREGVSKVSEPKESTLACSRVAALGRPSAVPAISLATSLGTHRLPVHLQMMGRRFDDATVLTLAAAFERAAPWAHLRSGWRSRKKNCLRNRLLSYERSG